MKNSIVERLVFMKEIQVESWKPIMPIPSVIKNIHHILQVFGEVDSPASAQNSLMRSAAESYSAFVFSSLRLGMLTQTPSMLSNLVSSVQQEARVEDKDKQNEVKSNTFVLPRHLHDSNNTKLTIQTKKQKDTSSLSSYSSTSQKSPWSQTQSEPIAQPSKGIHYWEKGTGYGFGHEESGWDAVSHAKMQV